MTGNIISIVCIGLGAVLIALAARKISSILLSTKGLAYHSQWKMLFQLVLGFLAFYIATGVLILLDYNWLIIPLIGAVFLAGGLFVWLVSRTTHRTLRELNETSVSKNQLEAINLQLSKSNEEIGKFAYIVSHDLKTPLRGISSLASFIEEDLGNTADEEVLKNLGLLRKKTIQMDLLINGILDYSRLKEEDVEKENLDLNSIVADTIDHIDVPEHFQLDIAPDLPTVFANETQLVQVFQNLISNVINYHDKEKGNIEIGFKEQENDYLFWVKDDGPGIPAVYHSRIFKMFTTLGTHDKSKGSGIGLSIVKQIIEGMGGIIWVESELGEGSTFKFTIKKTIKK